MQICLGVPLGTLVFTPGENEAMLRQTQSLFLSRDNVNFNRESQIGCQLVPQPCGHTEPCSVDGYVRG